MSKPTTDESSSESQLDTKCGMLCVRPEWIQRFANKRAFLFCFCTTSILQGMYFTYIVSVLSTLERLYQMPSRTMGLVLATSELGQIIGSLALAHFGGRGDRPKWIGAGVLVFAFASLLCSTPYFLLPSQHRSGSGSSLTAKIHSDNHLDNQSSGLTTNVLCSDSPDNHSLIHSMACIKNEMGNSHAKHAAFVATCVLTITSLLVGFGTTAVNTLGIPYIDDNVTSKESPLYFAITMGLRIFGPVLGFLLGSLCTSIYIDFPFGKPSDMNPSNAQWIGAWWLGVFIIGWLLFLISFFIMAFPKKLPQPQSKVFDRPNDEYVHRPLEPLLTDQCCVTTGDCGNKVCTLNNNQFEEKQMLMNKLNNQLIEYKPIDAPAAVVSINNQSFLATINRLLRNRILLCRIASTVLHILPLSGFYTFLPKYLENQFRLTASDASFVSGIAGILVMGIGIFSSGIVMRKCNLSPKLVSRWIAGATFVYAIGMLTLTTIGCSQSEIIVSHSHSLSKLDNSFVNLNQQSCRDCNCADGQFLPICSSLGVTYVSPCLAGCTKRNETSTSANYINCRCLNAGEHITKTGVCEPECNNFTLYVLIFSLLALIHSTTEVGGMLITLRCVQTEDKAIALGLITFGGSLLGSFPCPIIYGSLVDSTCLYWQQDCGSTGACRLFDNQRFRLYFHGLTGLCMLAAFFVDFAVCIMASDIHFDVDPPAQDKQVPAICVDSPTSSKISDSINDSNNNDKGNTEIVPNAQKESPL